MIILATPIQVQNITRLKVQAVNYENNEQKGQQWAEVWCDYGLMSDGIFYAYPIPARGDSKKYFKFEDNAHPEVPGMALGRCGTCNEFDSKIRGPCTRTPDCPGAVAGFPSYTRFRDQIDADIERDIFKAVDKFLTAGTKFPDPENFDIVRFLIDGATT